MSKFKDLPIGASFTFANGVSSFTAVCVKVSARCYTWETAAGQLKSQVGSVNVAVVAR